jgi:hypothetical protein
LGRRDPGESQFDYLQVSFQVSHRDKLVEARLNVALHLKLPFKGRSGENERWRRSSAGCERVQALAGEKRAKTLGA